MFLAKSNYTPKPEKRKLTERQRFERWHRRSQGWLAQRVESQAFQWFEHEERWKARQASARVKR